MQSSLLMKRDAKDDGRRRRLLLLLLLLSLMLLLPPQQRSARLCVCVCAIDVLEITLEKSEGRREQSRAERMRGGRERKSGIKGSGRATLSMMMMTSWVEGCESSSLSDEMPFQASVRLACLRRSLEKSFLERRSLFFFSLYFLSLFFTDRNSLSFLALTRTRTRSAAAGWTC